MNSERDGLNKIAETLGESISLRCELYDANSIAALDNPVCAECIALQEKFYGTRRCYGLHSHGVYQSAKWGGKYEYICELGITFISACIETNMSINYAFIAGPFMMVSDEDLLTEDLPGFFDAKKSKLPSLLKDIPYINPKRVSAIADIMAMVAGQCATYTREKHELMQEADKASAIFFDMIYQQKRIGEAAKLQLELEKKLAECIQIGEREKAQQLLNDILGSIYFSSSGDIETIKIRATELLVILMRRLSETGILTYDGYSLGFVREMREISSIEQMDEWLSRVLSSLMRSALAASEVKHISVIKRVHAYVNENHSAKVTLNELAEVVGLSVSYLSKIYREEMGETLVTYMNKVRVEHACTLLTSGSASLADVAHTVGFEDQSYFSKVFKKQVGMSPGKYREKYS